MRIAICLFAICALSFQFLDETSAQEKPTKRVADVIYDVGDGIVVIPSVQSSAEHFQNAFEAITTFKFDLGAQLKGSFPHTMNMDKPAVIYDFDKGRQTVQMPFDRVELIRVLARDPEGIKPGVPFPLKDSILTGFPVFWNRDLGHGLIKDGHLIASPNKKPKEGESDFKSFDAFKDAKPLSESLDARMIELFDRTGFGFFARPKAALADLPVFWGWGREIKNLNAREQDLVEKIHKAQACLNAGAVGITYQKDQFNGEFHLKYSRDDAFDDLFDFAAANEHKFDPTIGLPAENLLFSLSTQTSIFKSPDLGRLLLKLSVPSVGSFLQLNLDNSFFSVTGNLLADSQNDIAGVRIAIYKSADSAFSAVAILDARDPEQFFDELQKLMAMVEPETEEGLSPAAVAEIERLIKDLGSRSYSTRESAETRLSLAARRAEPALKKAASESDVAEVRMRASRILRRLAVKPASAAKNLSNLNFWANYDPDIAIEKGTTSLFDQPARLLRITHPPTFTDMDSRKMSSKLKQLFGQNWNRVPVVRVGDRFVVMIGGDDKAMEQTIDNLKRSINPIKKIATSEAPYFNEGNLQMHFSFARISETFVDGVGQFTAAYIKDYEDDSKLTSVSFQLLPDYWQSTLNMPIEELRPFANCGEFFRD